MKNPIIVLIHFLTSQNYFFKDFEFLLKEVISFFAKFQDINEEY